MLENNLKLIKQFQLRQMKESFINQARRYRKSLVIMSSLYVLKKHGEKAFLVELIENEVNNTLNLNISNIITIKIHIQKDNQLNDLNKSHLLEMLFLLLDKDFKIFTKAFEDNHNKLIDSVLRLDKIKDKNLIKFIYDYPKNIITKKVNSTLNARHLKVLKNKFDIDLKSITDEVIIVLDNDSKIDFAYTLETKDK